MNQYIFCYSGGSIESKASSQNAAKAGKKEDKDFTKIVNIVAGNAATARKINETSNISSILLRIQIVHYIPYEKYTCKNPHVKHMTCETHVFHMWNWNNHM